MDSTPGIAQTPQVGDSTRDQVVAILQDAYAVMNDGRPLPDDWSMDDDLFVRWGFDSLAMASVAIEIQRTFRVRMSDSGLRSVRSPRDLVALVESETGEAGRS